MKSEIYQLVSYFRYHPKTRMTDLTDERGVGALAALFSRRLRQGFTQEAMQKAVDMFYVTRNTSDMPSPNDAAFAFCSNQFQSSVLDTLDLVLDDPVLDWFVSGMPDRGPFIEGSRGVRSLILAFDEGLLRYPEVLADALRMMDNAQEAVYFVHNLIAYQRFCTGETQFPDIIGLDYCDDILTLRNLLCRQSAGFFHLPVELDPLRSSKKHVRPRHQTVQTAVMQAKALSGRKR
jgi:hypothetical protein